MPEDARKPIHTYKRRIEFVDTDISGNVHFSRLFVFMETAEHEFLRSIGTTVHLEEKERTIGWPRVQAKCTYYRPLRFGDKLTVQVFVERKGTKSMTYEFGFYARKEKIAEGKMTSVCCVLSEGGGLDAIPIPDMIARRIDALATQGTEG